MATLVDVICADSLQTLKLSRCGLLSCRQLVELNISDNNIGSHGMASLAEGLKSCRQLVRLDISVNYIGSHGMSSLAEGLKSCRQLVKLEISYNNIGSHGMASLAEGLQYCTNLQVLNLSNNNITSDVAAIVGVMKRCRYLQELDLIRNSIGMDGAAVLVGGWQHKSMLILHLRDNLSDPHESALRSGKKCCGSCDHLLVLFTRMTIWKLSFAWK